MTIREYVLYEVIFDLRKAYDALDRDQCIYIMMGYGIRPQT